MSAYIVGGLVLGGIYAISVLGLVLSYTSSRVFNFAHGAIAYFVAVFYYWLHNEHGWSTAGAGVVSILVVSPLIGLFLWAVLFRRLTHASPAVRLVSTVGLWVAIPPLTLLLFGDKPYAQPSGLAGDTAAGDIVHIAGVAVNGNQLAVLCAAVLVAGVLSAALRFPPFGLAVRATVDSPACASNTGINTSLVTAGSWMIGTLLAGLSGVLLAPILGLEQTSFTLLIIASFAAVVVARMTSLPLAFAGAMLLGLAQEVSVKYLPSSGVLSRGIRPSIPFALMAVFLLAYRGLRRERFEVDTRAAPVSPDLPAPVVHQTGWRRLVRPGVVAIALLIVPQALSGYWLSVVAQGIALSIIFLSYVVVTGEGGMLSLAQVSFAGVGAVVTANLATGHGMSTFVAVLLGALAAVPFGVLVALPSLRLGDLYLALATLAFAVLMDNLFFAQDTFDHFGSGVAVPRPRIGPIGFRGDTAFYYLLLVVFCALALLVVNLRRSTTGLVLASMRGSEPAAATLGISIVRAKLVTFAFSAFLAGLGGGLFATAVGRATILGFNALIGIVWLAVVVTWGIRSTLGAVFAGVSFAVVPVLINQHLPQSWGQLTPILFGLGAVALAREPRGVVYRTVQGHRERRARRAARAASRRAAVVT